MERDYEWPEDWVEEERVRKACAQLNSDGPPSMDEFEVVLEWARDLFGHTEFRQRDRLAEPRWREIVLQEVGGFTPDQAWEIVNEIAMQDYWSRE